MSGICPRQLLLSWAIVKVSVRSPLLILDTQFRFFLFLKLPGLFKTKSWKLKSAKVFNFGVGGPRSIVGNRDRGGGRVTLRTQV